MWPHNHFQIQKTGLEYLKKLKAREFVHVFTRFHIMRKSGAHNDNETGEPHSILGAKNIRSFSLKILFFLNISDTSRNLKIWGSIFISFQIQILI